MIDATRLHLLEAMGIDVYTLRARTEAVAGASGPSAGPSASDDGAGTQEAPRLAVVCARGVRDEAHLARLFKQLPQTFGVAAATIGWLEADAAGELAGPIEAPAYLVFGAAMARALGAQLSTMQQNTAAIAVTADPALLPGTAADKRALWQAFKPIARRLREAAV